MNSIMLRSSVESIRLLAQLGLASNIVEPNRALEKHSDQ
jgi:hypothetical protein